MRMGVVADDITGSNDIGIMFAKGGYLTHVYSQVEADELTNSDRPQPDIVILNTNSRLDPPETAYQKVYKATQALYQAGCRQFHNKTCSVFRGNIGVEFDAMLDALHLEFAVVVLGFPKNGRVTREGIHYVHGKRLEESEFMHDPIHPMRRSDLVEILQSQTRRRVGLVTHDVVSQGAAALRAHIDSLRGEYQYVILDVLDQESLATIAFAVHDEPVLCGSSALAEELPAPWGAATSSPAVLDIPRLDHLGILVTAGSLMPQTAAQIEHLRQAGAPSFELDTVRLFDSQQRQGEVERLVAALTGHLQRGEDVIFHSPNTPDAVQAARQAGARQGYSVTEVSRRVSEALAEVTERVLKQSGQNRLVVAGGETSAAVCDRLGVNGLRVWEEIQPGLPSCLSLTHPPLWLVLKSGSFGKPNFFEQAIDHLRQV